MLKLADIEKSIIGIVSEVCDIDANEIGTDSLLFDDIGISSVTIVEVMSKVEQLFGLEFDSQLYNPELYRTVGDLVHKIQEKIS